MCHVTLYIIVMESGVEKMKIILRNSENSDRNSTISTIRVYQ